VDELAKLIKEQKRELMLNKHENRIYPEVIRFKKKKQSLTKYNLIIWLHKAGFKYKTIGKKIWGISGSAIKHYLNYHKKRANHND